uniref:Interleukin 23 receptor n=1 Tax=Anas platyrhynchos TaxID=8839 RepID=A0A8B9TUN7_ANAPL
MPRTGRRLQPRPWQGPARLCRGRCAGVAQIKCLGSVWIEPGLEVLMGSNISINCLSTVGCPRSNLSIQLNSTARNETLRPLNGSAAQLRLHDFRLPYSSVLCFDHCGSKENKVLVCGTEVWAGYPPETPGNLTCTIGEDSGSLACTWDAGRPTHLRTEYRLHLNRTCSPQGSPVPLSALRGGSRYLAWVQARNALGTALSAPALAPPAVVPALPLAEGAETTLGSPPITTVRWRQQTQLEDVHCEERHKAEDAPMWHVEAWDSAVRAGHPLQSDTHYVFQARCRRSPPNSPWSAWSPPFMYTTPEAGKCPVCCEPMRCDAGCTGLVGQPYIHPHPAHGRARDVGLCLIKATVASLLPKWLREDFPHMENSNVIKSLQEKSEFTSNTSCEPFLDPTIMEVEEMSAHEKYKNVDIKKKPSTAVPENVEHPQSSAPAVSTAPEHVSDYKPQISDGSPLGYVAANIYQAQSHTPAPEPETTETTFFFRDYTSPVSYLWNAEGAEHNVCLLEKINLILNNNRSGQNYAFSSAQEENQWEKTLSSENVQEQTLVPDELVSCLRAKNEEPRVISTGYNMLQLLF